MKKNYTLLMLLFVNTVLFAQNNDFNNGAADGGLWSNTANWSLAATPSSLQTVRTANSAVSFVNANFTIKTLQNLNSTTGDRYVNSSAGGILTIDPNTATLASAIAIQNVSSSPVKLGLRGKITIQNSIPTAFSRITSANNIDNSIEFESTSVLNLQTPLEIFKAGGATSGNNYTFNGKIEGTANIRIAANTTATFGNAVSNAGYTGEIVLSVGSSLIVNTTDNIVFYDGIKIQVNGNNASTTLNGANVFNSGITVGGTNTYNFNVNKNQSGLTFIIFQGGGTLNMVINSAVTNLTFADNSANPWLTGTLNITGFQNGVIRFGTNNQGLTAAQLTQITADNGGEPLALDSQGFLVNASTLSNNQFEIDKEMPIIKTTLVNNQIDFNSPQNNVKIIDMSGRILFTNSTINQNNISVDFLVPGHYIAVFADKSVERFIKQ